MNNFENELTIAMLSYTYFIIIFAIGFRRDIIMKLRLFVVITPRKYYAQLQVSLYKKINQVP